MPAIDSVKNRLIDRILVTKNEKLLEAIESIFVSTEKESVFPLQSEQIEMLMMSEEDIKYDRLISESDLDKQDTR